MPKDWDAACAIYSPDADWSASAGDGPLKFLDLSMPWVFKAMVWLTTFQRTKQGLWLGPAMTGDPREDLSEVALADPCVCGSGRAFEGCCRPEVEQRAHARKKELLAAAIDGVMSSSANLPSEG
jgi:hypothetical protein